MGDPQRFTGGPSTVHRWTLNGSQVDPQRFTGGPSTLVPTHLMRFTFGGFAGAAHESRQVRQAKRPQARRQRSVCGAMACRLSCAAASLPRVTIISLCERAERRAASWGALSCGQGRTRRAYWSGGTLITCTDTGRCMYSAARASRGDLPTVAVFPGPGPSAELRILTDNTSIPAYSYTYRRSLTS